MIVWLVLLGLLLGDDRWLVLTNGKVMELDRFERRDDKVMIFRQNQMFSVPARMVDWQATELKNDQERRLAAEKQAAEAQPEITREPRKPIVLVDDGRSKEASSKPATVPYRSMGNSIIVSVSINGSGPFEVLLDTGASMTLINPEVIGQLNAQMTQDTVPLVGLGGAVNARQAILDSLSLGPASVRDFKVAAHQLPTLTAMGVSGLLGQDFLNFFVMELDSSAKMLTLTPHHPSTVPMVTAELADQAAAALDKYWQFSAELDHVFRRIGVLARRFFNRSEHATAGGAAQELRGHLDKLNEIRNFNDRARDLLSQFIDENMVEDREMAQRYLRCYSHYDRFLQDAQRLCQMLRRGFSLEGRDASMIEQIRRQERVVMERYEAYAACMQ